MLIPLILVNGIAVYAQTEFWQSHLPWPLFGAVIFAIALESIAVYLAYYAHLAELSEDSALRLRVASYGFGAVIGFLNASHYLNNGAITAAAIGVGIVSASSPWLWAIRTRRLSRDSLKTKGLIEDRAVKLGAMRWILWPKESFPVFRNAIWTGENNPIKAIADWEEKKEDIEDEPITDTEITVITAQTQAQAIRIAFGVLGDDAKTADIVRWLSENPDRKWNVSPTRVRQIRIEIGNKEIENRRKDIRALPGGNQ